MAETTTQPDSISRSDPAPRALPRNAEAAIAQSDLPEPITTLIRRLIKRSRLWRKEKRDVAMELIAHFEDGLAAGETPQQLIHDFGDPDAAAQLIRRAKKRNRSLLWRDFVRLSQALGVFALIYLATGVYLVSGQPTISVDYLAELNKRASAVPASDRAWPLYRQVLPAMEFENEPEGLREAVGPDDPGWAEMRAFVSGYESELATLRQAGLKPGLGLVLDTTGSYNDPVDDTAEQTTPPAQPGPDSHAEPSLLIGVLLPHLTRVRTGAVLLMADARLAMAEGDIDRAIADYDATLGMARHVREHPILINDLVGIAIGALAAQSMEHMLETAPEHFTDAHLQHLAHRFAEAREHAQVSFDGERMFFYDLVQHMYTDDGNGDGHITEEGLSMMSTVTALAGSDQAGPSFGQQVGGVIVLPAANLLMASRRDLVQTYDRLMDMQQRQAEQPMWEKTGPTVDDELQAMMADPIVRVRYMLIVTLMPALDRAAEIGKRHEAHIDGLLTGIALELYRRRHGEYPDALEALTPRYLPQAPVDRLTGQPIQYRIVEGQPVIYSVGRDGDDDGGRPALSRREREPDRFEAMQNRQSDGDWILYGFGTAQTLAEEQ